MEASASFKEIIMDVLIVVLILLVAIGAGVWLYVIFQMARVRWVVNNLKNLRMETVFDTLGDPDSVRFYFGKWKLFELDLLEGEFAAKGSFLNTIYQYWVKEL